MFNGIIDKIGIVKYIKKDFNSSLVGVETDLRFNNQDISSSVSFNGVCLTIIKVKKKIIFFYISKETLDRSNLKSLKVGDMINLEKSIILGQEISGHFVQGHVDTTALVKNFKIIGKTWVINFILKDKKLSKFIIEKASIAINGVSLTISKVKNNYFEVNVIPHTLNMTNLKKIKIKTIVNVELDIFVKYILKVSN